MLKNRENEWPAAVKYINKNTMLVEVFKSKESIESFENKI